MAILRVSFLLFFLCLIYANANSQQQVVFDFSVVTASRIPLSVTVRQGATFSNLSPGITYETIASNEPSLANIKRINGNETFSPAFIEIEGSPNSLIVVHFTLPHRLYPESGKNGFILIDYHHLSASIFNPLNGDYHFFNPEIGISLSIPHDGQPALLYLGGNPQVAPISESDRFIGFGIVTVEYS